MQIFYRFSSGPPRTIWQGRRRPLYKWPLLKSAPGELPSTYPTLSYEKILVSPRIGVLPSGTLSETLNLENFATASRSHCQQNSSSSSSSTVELVDDTYTTVDESWLFSTSRSNVTRGKSGPALGGTEYRLMPSACRLIVRAKL